MAGYIGKVQITGSDPVLVGSTLFGICNTQANTALKAIDSTSDNSGKFINNNMTTDPLQGTTIHVKFNNGNTVTSGMYLKIGTTLQNYPVVGRCVCDAGTVISFTLDETPAWVVNDNVDTNTEYVFKTAYNASTNKAVTEADLTDLNIQDAAHKDVIDNIANNTTSTDLPTTTAVVSYVQSMTGGLAGLSGAMHFRGIVTDPTVTITEGGTQLPKIEGYDLLNGEPKSNFSPEAGDVILFGTAEYVWSSTAWELLGDQSSYALKSNTDTVTEVSNFTANTLPTLTVEETSVSSVSVTNGSAASLTTNNVTIPNVTAAGSATEASVSNGILTITVGSAPTIASTDITVKEVGTFTANTPTVVTATPVQLQNVITFTQGTQASLNTNNVTVVVPIAPSP